MKILLPTLLALLLVPACSRFSRKADVPQLQPAANPAVAAATSFSTTLTEVSLDQRGVIASGTITTNAPLATATEGRYSLNPSPSGAVAYAGNAVASRLGDNSSGRIRVHRSGDQAVLELLTAEGQLLLKIIGPPHGNAIRSSWFHEGAESGLATLTPR